MIGFNKDKAIESHLTNAEPEIATAQYMPSENNSDTSAVTAPILPSSVKISKKEKIYNFITGYMRDHGNNFPQLKLIIEQYGSSCIKHEFKELLDEGRIVKLAHGKYTLKEHVDDKTNIKAPNYRKNFVKPVYEFLCAFWRENNILPMNRTVAKHFNITDVMVYYIIKDLINDKVLEKSKKEDMTFKEFTTHVYRYLNSEIKIKVQFYITQYLLAHKLMPTIEQICEGTKLHQAHVEGAIRSIQTQNMLIQAHHVAQTVAPKQPSTQMSPAIPSCAMTTPLLATPVLATPLIESPPIETPLMASPAMASPLRTSPIPSVFIFENNPQSLACSFESLSTEDKKRKSTFEDYLITYMVEEFDKARAQSKYCEDLFSTKPPLSFAYREAVTKVAKPPMQIQKLSQLSTDKKPTNP